MAGSLVTGPDSPASCYRPLRFDLVRTDPAGTLIVEVFIADAGDVSSLGNGLEVGDVVVYYTGSVFGGIPVVAGQTIIMDADCGPYTGVQMVTNAFDDGGDHYAVIDALDQGDFTPASMTGGFKVWLNNYSVHLRILIYTDPVGTPQTVDLKAQPGPTGHTYFHADTRIKDYFSHEIHTFMGPVPGGGVVQNAHGVTALFYRVHIAEVYDVPGETTLPDPFDGTHDIHVDDVEDLATMRVAVNAVHPYAGSLIDWSSADMGLFVVGGDGSEDYERKVLSNIPSGDVVTQSGSVAGRKLTLASSDHFGIFLLTDPEVDHEVDYRLRIYDLSDGTPSIHSDVVFSLDDLTSSFCVRIGPADLGEEVEGLTKYSVWLRSNTTNFLCEPIEITVDPKCKENRRSFAWLNKLGGVDQYTFTGREISSSKTKRATVRKPYSPGNGFDWTERQYRAEPERTGMVSTAPVSRSVRKWLVQDLHESPNVNVMVEGRPCTATILTDQVVSDNTGGIHKPVTLEYRLGVDNLSQQA